MLHSIAMNATEAYHELCAWTLSLRDPEFIHQHVVDTFMAQNATESTKPIGIVFALVGLYLHLEKGFTGKEVQRAHMKLAERKQTWPSVVFPADRGTITAIDVLAAPDRARAIDDWCASVWHAYRGNRATIGRLLQDRGIC
jgi:uncharacterized protein DUF5946